MDTECCSCEGYAVQRERDAAVAGLQNIAQEDSGQHRAECDSKPLAAEHLYSLPLCWGLVYTQDPAFWGGSHGSMVGLS